MSFRKLRQLRQQRVLALRELEEESGASYNTIWRIENGYREVRPSTIRKLAAALKVEPQELVKIEETDDA